MSAPINDGGPAFPCDTIVTRVSGKLQGHEISSAGLSMRDYFAGKAMPMAMNRLRENYTKDLGKDWHWVDEDWQFLADRAYEAADAMIKARSAA